MDHSYIEERNIIARYEMRKLSEAECVLFEEHFVDCSECQQELAVTRDFRKALRTAAAADQDWRQLNPSRQPLSAPLWMLASAAVVALLAVSSVFLARQTRGLRGELDQARAASATWQRQYEAEHHASKTLEQQLEQTREKSPENPPAFGDSSKLPILASVFVLNKIRGGDTSDSTPVNLVVTSRTPQWIVLSVDTEDEPPSQSYRVTITGPANRQAWSESHLVPTASNTLSITLPSRLLSEGDYQLTVEALTREGTYTTSGRYPFRRSAK